jgi:hypothetical protein
MDLTAEGPWMDGESGADRESNVGDLVWNGPIS